MSTKSKSESVARLEDFIVRNCKVGDRLDIQTGNVPGGLGLRSHPAFAFRSTAQAVRALERAGILEARSLFRMFEVRVLKIPGTESSGDSTGG